MKYLVVITAPKSNIEEYLKHWQQRLRSELKVLFYPHIALETVDGGTSIAVIETDQVNSAVTYCKNLLKTATDVKLIPLLDEKEAAEELDKFKEGKIRADKEYREAHIDKIKGLGSTDNLEILPLIDWHTEDQDLKVETGVSYVVKTDDTTILFDTGLNSHDEDPSPLLQNMEKLGMSVEDIDLIFITHNHGDHVGGSKWAKKKTFSLSGRQIGLKGKRAYTPIPMTYPGLKPIYSPNPTILGEGIVTTGTIANSIYFMGYAVEQSLAINVKDKGIVLIVGCGHHTLPRLLERTSALFDEPLYGLVGGLHYPVMGGPIELFGYAMHKHFGTGKVPWEQITQDELSSNVESLKKLNPKVVALSPHDSSELSLKVFKDAFPEECRRIVVGQTIII
jgi:7,8-dihydropterin-6-yl-methyl-4-(beta-D-ribofuranosyl)aminobenzene 5'-phosphate synthase